MIRKFIFCILLISLFNSINAFSGGVYNKTAQKQYYLSSSFRKGLYKKCNFQTNIVNTARREVESLEEAYKLIAKIANLKTKYSWSPEINPQKSFVIHEGDNSLGMIYHFAYKNNIFSFLGANEGYSDYYREIAKKDYFKGCILDTNSTLKNASFEYKIVEENSKIYIERTARIIPKIAIPSSIARAKLAQMNKEYLEKVVNSSRS